MISFLKPFLGFVERNVFKKHLIHTCLQYTIFYHTRCFYKQFRCELGAYQIRIVEGLWENKTLEITLFILVYSILYFFILDAVISNLDANQEPIRSIQQKAFEGMIHLKYILFILGYSILYSQQLVVWYTVYYTQVQIRYVLNESCPQKPSTIWI